MEYANIASTSVLVNGIPTSEFEFKRRLPQADSLSLFLFLLVVEDLDVLMKASIVIGRFMVYLVGLTDQVFVVKLGINYLYK